MLSRWKDSDVLPDAEGRRGDFRDSGNDTRNHDRSEAVTMTMTARKTSQEHDWDMVEVATSASEGGVLDRPTGILILCGENDVDTSALATLSSENHLPTMQTPLTSPMESDTTYIIEDLGDIEDFSGEHSDIAVEDEEEKEEEVGFVSSIRSEVPSSFDNFSYQSQVSTQLFTNHAKHGTTPNLAKPGATPTLANTAPISTTKASNSMLPFNDHDDDDDKESPRHTEGLRTLSDELAVVEAIFNRTNARMILNPCALLYVSMGLAVFFVIGTFLVMERRAWEASSRRLEERIEQLQLELLLKFDAERERTLNMAVTGLEQEFKKAIQVQGSIDHMRQEPKPEPPCASSTNYFWNSFIPDESSNTNDRNVHFENCWIQAESKLGECAHEARKAFRSKFQILGRSLWQVQEKVVGKVNDFGKRIHTAAKEAAERVVVEAEQWSNNTAAASNDGGSPKRKANFQGIATTLVSSVALASLAGFVADQASAYFAAGNE